MGVTQESGSEKPTSNNTAVEKGLENTQVSSASFVLSITAQ